MLGKTQHEKNVQFIYINLCSTCIKMTPAGFMYPTTGTHITYHISKYANFTSIRYSEQIYPQYSLINLTADHPSQSNIEVGI